MSCPDFNSGILTHLSPKEAPLTSQFFHTTPTSAREKGRGPSAPLRTSSEVQPTSAYNTGTNTMLIPGANSSSRP